MTKQLARSEETYRFIIDGKEYVSAQRYLTGAQLRQMAHIEPEFRLFLEKHREENERRSHTPDREVEETYAIDLAEPGEEMFYTLHAPTLDIH